MGAGKDRQYNGALVVTNRRVAFYRKGFFGEVFETIHLKNLTSIEQKTFMGHRVLRMHTSHDQLEFKTFDKAAYDAVVAVVEQGRQNNAQPANQAVVAGASPLEMLKQLGELKEAGLVSAEEFEAKKAALLAKL